jgi:aspartate/methionine/tyrosine aminotransferase
MYEQFCLERWQSLRDFRAHYNLSESGIEPLRISELGGIEDAGMSYGHTKGVQELRGLIASQYEACDSENVLVTNGGSEANYVATVSTIQSGDEVVVEMPNYMQIVGLLKGIGAKIKYFWLKGDEFRFDADEFSRLVTTNTKAVFLTNPNNPSGTVIQEEELKVIAKSAREADAYVISDEVYRGLEHQGDITPSMLDLYEKSLVTSSLSKVYGLPGLRIGWVAGPRDDIERAWEVKDYTSISPAIPSQKLAVKALERQSKFIERARTIINTNMGLARTKLEQSGAFVWRTPAAAPFILVRTSFTSDTLGYCEYLFEKGGVLINPGECFEMPGYVRIGLGSSDKQWLNKALGQLVNYTTEYIKNTAGAQIAK